MLSRFTTPVSTEHLKTLSGRFYLFVANNHVSWVMVEVDLNHDYTVEYINLADVIGQGGSSVLLEEISGSIYLADCGWEIYRVFDCRKQAEAFSALINKLDKVLMEETAAFRMRHMMATAVLINSQ